MRQAGWAPELMGTQQEEGIRSSAIREWRLAARAETNRRVEEEKKAERKKKGKKKSFP